MLLSRDRVSFKLKLWSFPLALTLIATSRAIASAQIVPDNTLPQNSIVAPNGEVVEITGGTTEGNNLFHSFEQFSVLNRQTAFFNNVDTIANIISRVTGRSISDIDGLIKANGTANLFLLNPNGIIFSENASLDIGGSFIGSTADSIQFADGTEFSAINPNTDPLLTVSIPVGLQYGEDNGDITVEGLGNGLFIDSDTFTVDRNDRPIGLSVESGKTLALVGGNVFVEGGNLTAPQGNIELGSIAGEGTVKLTPDSLGWKLGYEEVNGFQEINLSQAASLEASGNSGGRVKVRGDFVSLTDGSAILTDTLGDGIGGSLTIEASETEIYGAAENGFTSSLFTNVDLGATGNGGDLLIDTGFLYVGGGAQVNVNTFGEGDAGTLTVQASEIELFSVSDDEVYFSGLYAQADIGETGKGGDINIETDLLLLDDSAEISVNTFGDGDAGNIKIQAQEIELLGSFGYGSGLFASADEGSTGNGGSLEINTDRLYIADGSQATVSTFGDGDGGNLSINANEIELVGTSPDGLQSGLFASSELEATGDGGNLEINTDLLAITDGAQVIVSTFGDGDGGNLSVNANEIELTGASFDGSPSALFTAAQTDSTGNAGDLQIRTNQLNIKDSAQIAVSTSGTGNAGNLNIVAQDINLIGSNNFGSSSILSNAFISTGDAGEIAIATDNLSIQDGATISASNFFSGDGDVSPGEGMAGNITIDANTIQLNTTIADNPSSINASTNNQSGGNITLNVDSAILSNNSQITSETQGVGNGGNIEFSADILEVNSGARFSTNTAAGGNGGSINLTVDTANFSDAGSGVFSEVEKTATGNGGSVNISADEFNLTNKAQISVNSKGLGQAGNINIVSDALNLDEGQITATSTQTGGGEINLVTDSIFLDNNSLITTSVTDSTGGGGNIFINNSGFIIGQNNSKIEADAFLGQGGNIEIKSTGIFFDVPLEDAVTASSKFGKDGVVEISSTESDKKLGTVQLPNNIDSPEAVIVSSCPVPETNTFVVLGKGGIPENPELYLRGQALWQDLRMLSEKTAKLSSNSLSIPKYPQKKALIEAKTWKLNSQGNVELIANNSNDARNAIASNHAQSYFSHNLDSCSQSMTNYRSTFISQDKFSY